MVYAFYFFSYKNTTQKKEYTLKEESINELLKDYP